MQQSFFQDVGDFHKKFGLPYTRADRRAELLTDNVMLYRVNFMLEELLELSLAHQKGDLEACADGLIDLVYVALGTAQLMGIPWGPLWREVQRANMAKERGETKRAHGLDVRKPPGWVGPQHKPILDAWNAAVMAQERVA